MILMFDIECYKNYFLLGLKNIGTGNTMYFEMMNDDDSNFDRHKMKRLLTNNTIAGFNSENYDLPMIKGALMGMTNQQLKNLSDTIIVKGKKYWEVNRQFNLPPLKLDHIDLCNVAPTFGTLKIYGGRLNAPKMQDLPIEPSATITVEDAAALRSYCLGGDLELTELLHTALLPQLDLRRTMSAQYKIDLMAKSDAQIAEAVFKHELSAAGVDVHKVEISPGTEFKYDIPSFVTFESIEFAQALQDVREAVFIINDKGSVVLPDNLKKPYVFDGAKYKMGIGGLHSQEKKQVIIAKANETLKEKDVTSYYPNIILNQGLYPKHLGTEFNNVYRTIVDRRVHAKATGDKITNESLKVTINSSFGKFGSKYSVMYSPSLLIQTTLTGQLCLMMLVERLSAVGVKICSANTDGIVLLYDNNLECDVEEVCFNWEMDTGFNLEDTFYKALYSRDVNNYLAIKPDNSYKGKGIFTLNTLSKNPSNVICYEAVIDYLVNGADIEATIVNCEQPEKFTTIRTVNGGANFEGELIGKSIRWYYSDEAEGFIAYAKNGNKVPKSDGAKPMMELTESVPSDLDYNWYITEANEILGSLGI